MAVSSEFDLIRRYFTRSTRSAVLGVGDDAALIRANAGTELAISIDTLVEGTHFFANADPQSLGHKALAVNLSDMAAMGATPRWALLALTLPRVNESWLKEFSRGFHALAKRYNVELIGGDTTRGALNINVTIVGEVPTGKALRRDGARVGDDIWVSGTLGDAALALAAIQKRVKLNADELKKVEQRLHKPQPRVALGLALRGIARSCVTSAIDVSDGLLADLGHILERSHVAAHLEFAQMPASTTLSRHLRTKIGKQALLAGGDDYELCFTAPCRARDKVLAAAKRAKVKVTCIGSIEKQQRGWDDLVVFDADGSPMKSAMKIQNAGYDHFR